MQKRYICIHGHFYQPPRENPWLEAVEIQDSAQPYHDWNERITFECYAPNAAARILTDQGWIKQIINNYARISFNFGPTLLDWLESNEPEVYQAILDADRKSMSRFSGHGSAIAQAYNHIIMPLANRQDKYTQVIWGIRDFEKRFGRQPEGMWLPETAVDLETLEVMAEHGLKYTILTPYQARRFRKINDAHWQEVGAGGIDPSRPYQIRLPWSGQLFNIFFYNGPISQAVAFNQLLSNGELFAQKLLSGFSASADGNQLMHIATDGETYGHHHRFGEMALAYALDYIESNNLATITNYGEYLAQNPPTYEVEIHEHTAWSCAHGVERWRANCGCNSGLRPGFSQEWRTPLRQALNWLRCTLDPKYEDLAGELLQDPWAARNQYIEVVLDRSPDNINNFLARQARTPLSEQDRVTVLKLLEMQRHAMLMYTSCGWFFDDIGGIESVQVLMYAKRVIHLGEELFGEPLEPNFLEILSRAKSNLPDLADGAGIFKKTIQPKVVDLPKVGAHFAISSLFEKFPPRTKIYCYTVERLDFNLETAGTAKLTLGLARISSDITLESTSICYGAVYFGYHNVNVWVNTFYDEQIYREMVREVSDAFNQADLPGVIRMLDRYFDEGLIYSLRETFKDQKRKIVNKILETTLGQLETDFRKIYEQHATLMKLLIDLGIPLPHALNCAADFRLNTDLRHALATESPDLDYIASLLRESKSLKIKVNGEVLSYVLGKTLEGLAEKLQAQPQDLTRLKNLDSVTGLAKSLPFSTDLWKVQNIYHRLWRRVYPSMQEKAARGDEGARNWLQYFNSLGDKLQMQRD